MINADSPHGLLIRHLTDWARAKERSVDPGLLEELLHLRAAYDDIEPTYWPLGSVEHLLLERWPSQGGVQVPDPQVLVETLDAYFRFLRSTARMAARSGDPNALTKEARRAARRMPEAAADVANWSTTKVLMDYGRSIGIEVDDVPDVETLESRLAEIQSRWNALPTEERTRRMPPPHRATSPPPDPSLSGSRRAMAEHGVDDPTVALLRTFTDRLPAGEAPTPDVVAPIFQNAPYLAKVRALAGWVGAGRDVTSTGVLRPALAHLVHDHLGLGEWTLGQLHRQHPDERHPGVAAVGREAWIEREANRPWSRAAECEALHRLWCGALACGAISVSGRRVVAVDEPGGDARRWVSMGIRSAGALMNLLLGSPYSASPVVYALLTSYVRGRAPVTRDEIGDFVTDWRRSPEDRAHYDDLDFDIGSWERPAVDVALGKLADTGLYTETADSITLTDAGDVFVRTWLGRMEHRPGGRSTPPALR